MRIAIRTDASATIGAGHLMRCLSLAEGLRRIGHQVTFFCRTLPGHQCDAVTARGFAVQRLPAGEAGLDWHADLAHVRSACADAPPFDWFIVDHYQLDARWEQAARALARRIAVIDDLADRPHDGDLIIDQNLRAGSDSPYAALNARPAEILLGPRYALLRPTFADLRDSLAPRDGSVRRIIVCFGGADPHNHAGVTLEALRARLDELECVDVFAGASCAHRDALAELCRTLGERVVLHPPHADPAFALARADLALGAGGTMSWERACLGVPTIAFGIADNQRAVLDALLEGGFLLGQSDFPKPQHELMRAWLEIALASPALLKGLSQRCLALVDGRGVERVINAMTAADADTVALTLRPATLADRDDLLAWRNAPSIRAISLDGTTIAPDTHAAWLARTLANPARILLIAEQAGKPVGVVRFDLDGSDATISVYRVPGSTGRLHLIAHATAWLRRERPGIRRIIAEVLPGNATSLTAFRAAGYRESKSVLVHDLEPS